MHLRSLKTIATTFFISLFVIAGAVGVYSHAKAASGTGGVTPHLTGKALSTNFGLTTFDGPTQVNVDASGFLTGYAWNAGAGWLKFGGISNFPNEAGTTASNARIITTSGGTQKLVGWARFCSPVVGGLAACQAGENAAGSAGWTGWISFDGPNRGVTIGAEAPVGSGTHPISGYGWGADNASVGFGWFDMTGMTYVTDTEDDDDPLTPPLYLVANPNPTTTGLTDLTYSTDAGSDFDSCSGGRAVDDDTGASQVVAGWSNTLLTLSGANVSRTVANVSVPYTHTRFAVSCYDAATATTVTETILVIKTPLSASRIDLCLVDNSGVLAPNCGSGLSVSQYYPFVSTHAKLIWKTPSTTTFSSCVGIGGSTDWGGVGQTPAPTASYNTPAKNRLMDPGASTVYQLSCVDNVSGLTVVSNTATAIRAPEDLNPTLLLEGSKTGAAGPFVGAHTASTAIQLPVGGGTIHLEWATDDILSQCTVTSNPTGLWSGTQPPNGNDGPFTLSTSAVFRMDCPTGTSGSGSTSTLTDYVFVKVGTIPTPSTPSGQTKPVFIEI